MVSKSNANNNNNGGKNRGSGYKGVRKKKSGKWVSEIRVKKSRDRIWLGSYETAEKAAKAYDAAVLCMRGGGAGEFYNLNFPQNRSALETYLLSSNTSSSSSSTPTPNHSNRLPNNLTRSQIKLVASKYANRTNDVAPVAPAVPINSLAISSALPVADANFGLSTNSLDGSAALQTNSLDMSSALPAANANLMLLCQGEKVVAPSPMEPSVVENWHLNNSNYNYGLGSNQFYCGDGHAAMENRYSPVVAPIEGQREEGLLEDVIAPRGTSGTSGGGGNSGGDGFYQSSSADDPYYCWTY
ncbi:hypothetical protein MKX03_025289 [Papaver bracteatum]|nr:hypothetical protein MKX03_025289 [Papaver bracteatum]